MRAVDQRSFIVERQLRLTAVAKSVSHTFEAILAAMREQTGGNSHRCQTAHPQL